MSRYYDNWQTDEYNCPACNWHGVGSALGQGEHYRDLFELHCPVCKEVVTHVLYPTLREFRANWERLSDGERRHVECIERLRAEYEKRKLRESTPLPDIDEPSFVLHWDFVPGPTDSETLLKHGDKIIFREPAVYEGYERFIEVARLLRARYGSALRDLVPTHGSEIYLYGDELSSPQTVAKARRNIFSATGNA